MPGRQAHARGAPERFGKYELLDVVGKGGMAEVFRARATGPKGFARELAIKRILAHMSEDEEFVEMFVAEAKLSGALSHGNIVPIYEFGEVDGQLFLAMEFVDGTDLRTLLRRRRLAAERLSPTVAVHIAVEVLRGLGYAHARKGEGGVPLGLVHRDVSPSNILVSRAGEVKICDFGIAKAATRHTTSGRLKGKFSYMSPEQARGKPLDARSDLFSVGILLWEMLTGARLFQGDSDLSVLDQVREAQVPELPKLGIAGEDRLREVVQRALQPDPAKRWPDAASFATPLRAFLAQSHESDPVHELEQIVSAIGEEPARSVPIVDMTPSGVVPVEDSEARAPAPGPTPAVAPAPEAATGAPDAALASADTILHAPTQPDVSLPDPSWRAVPLRRGRGRLIAAVVAAAVVVAAIVALLTGRGEAPPPQITATPLVRPSDPILAAPPAPTPPAPAPTAEPAPPPPASPTPPSAPAAATTASPSAPVVARPPAAPAAAPRAAEPPRSARHGATPAAVARPAAAPSAAPARPAPSEPPVRPAAASAPSRPTPPPVKTVDPFALQR